jgi:hypothetical protein
MPTNNTAIKAFFDDLREGQSRVTRMLQDMFLDPGAHQGSPNMPALKTSGAFDGPLPQWARQALADAGLTEDDINHVDEWPQKEAVREALVQAIEGGTPISFSWEPHRGGVPETDVDADGTQIVVRFKTPLSLLRESADATGAVTVDLTPEISPD